MIRRVAKRRRITPRKKLPYRARRLRRRMYSGRKLGIATSYTFSRYLAVQPVSNYLIANGTYSSTTSVLSPNIGVDSIRFSQMFTLGSMPSVTEFQNLFDRYRIVKAVVTFKMTSNPDNGDVNNAFYPTLWYYTDYDDIDTVGLTFIREIQGVKRRVLQPNREVRIVLRPKPLQTVYNTAIASGYSIPRGKSPWIDLANSDVPHYGLKTCIDFEGVSTAGTLPLIKMNVQLFASFKGVR